MRLTCPVPSRRGLYYRGIAGEGPGGEGQDSVPERSEEMNRALGVPKGATIFL